MPRRKDERQLPDRESEQTPELAGFEPAEAWSERVSQAELGSAGNGAPLHGADRTGGRLEVEPEPGHPEDIVPDQIERFAAPAEEEEREITAQPNEREAIDLSEEEP